MDGPSLGAAAELAYHGVKLKKSDIGQIFEQYGAAVLRRARYLLGNPADAEEATQEVFIRAFQSAEVFEHRSAIYTWLVRITTNYCLNFIRDRRRRRELWEENVKNRPEPVCAQSPEGMITLRRILGEADESMARAAVYVLVDGMSHAEAAEILGVSRRTVGNLIERFSRFAEERHAAKRKEGS